MGYRFKKFLAWQLYLHYLLLAIGLYVVSLFFIPDMRQYSIISHVLGLSVLTVMLFIFDTVIHVTLNAYTGWDD